MKRVLIVCDIDGVLIDSSARDHLIPIGDDALNNESWIPHQSFTSGDVPIKDCGQKIESLIKSGNNTEILFLTSRMAFGDHVRVTLSLLPDIIIPLMSKHYCFRHKNDSRHSPVFKACELGSFILNSTTMVNYDEIILIDDLTSNLDSMAEVCDYYKIPCRKIHVVNNTEWNDKDDRS